MKNGIGVVNGVKGLIIDTNIHGQNKVLKVGDVIKINDTIHTIGNSSKIIFTLNNGQEFSLNGNDAIHLDKSVYQNESFHNDSIVSNDTMTNIIEIKAACETNNLEIKVACETNHSEIGMSGKAQYLNGGHESNISSTLRDSNINSDSYKDFSFNPINTPDINDAPIANDDINDAYEAGSDNHGNISIFPISAIGNIINNDTDIDNLHNNLSITNINGNNIPINGNITLIGNYGNLTIDSNGNYTYVINDTNANVNSLAVGENIQESFNYILNDNDSINPKTDNGLLTIIIHGTNDAPMITDQNINANVTEDSNNPLLTDNGNITFSDVDLSDTHQVNVDSNSDNLGQLTATVNENPNSDHGLIDWQYSVPNSETQYLAEGETKVETFNITVSDGHGGESTQTIHVTIHGNNDAPTAVVDHGDFMEDQLSIPIIPVQGSENLLNGLIDPDISDHNHFVSKISLTDGNYQNIDDQDGTLIKVRFDFTNVHNNQETIFIPVRINQDGTYDVSQNELLNKIPEGVNATGSFWYKIDDGHDINHLSQGEKFTINIHGQNDAPTFNITTLDNDNNINDIPVTFKLSGDRFNNNSLDAPQFNILVDGHKLNGDPLTIEQLRSYRIDNSLGTEDTSTSWEYVTFNVPNGTEHVEIQYIHDTWEGGHDVDGDGYNEDRNLIVDLLNIGGRIVTDNNGHVTIIGGTNLQAENPSTAIYTRSDGANESGRETMPWSGNITFDVHDTIIHSIPTDMYHTETISENELTNTNIPIVGDTNLLDGVSDIDGLKSDISVVKSDGTDFNTPIIVNLNVNDINGNPLTVEVNVNNDGTYSIIPNEGLNSLSSGMVATGTFDYKAKDIHNGLSDEQIFTIKIVGTNDQPVIHDIDVNTLIHESRVDNNLGTFNATLSETGENSSTFGKEQVHRIFHLGADHANQQVAIEFDMKEFGTWDGDGIWNAAHEQTQEAFLTFVNEQKVIDKIMGMDDVDQNSNDGGTIIEGNAGTWHQTDLHHFSIQTTTDSNGDIRLGFGSTLHEGLDNESYNIDNLSIVSTPIYEANTGLNTFISNFAPVQDADIQDTHTYHIVPDSLTSSVSSITDLSAIIINQDDGTYKISGDFNSLSAGETATISFQYTADDGHGFDGTDGINEKSISDPATITLTIVGTNDAPIIDLDGNSNSYTESFENLIDANGWTIIHEPNFKGDNNIVWQTEGNHHGLEVQYGNIGNSTASDGNVHAELDSDQLVTLSTNIHISNDTATLTFDYKPRLYHESDSNMKVSLGNHSFIIGENGITANNTGYDISIQTNPNNGWETITVHANNLTFGNTELTFTGLGLSDSYGAYLDNISLINTSVNGDNNFDTTYIQNDNPISIVDTDMNITDVDNTHIQNATITLTNDFDGDKLAIDSSGLSMNVHMSLDQHTIHLVGNASLSDYENAIKTITYENTNHDIVNETNRIINVTVNDGIDNSNTVSTTIHVSSNINGTANNDIFNYDNYSVNGHDGIDTLLFQNDVTVDFSLINSGKIQNIEILDLNNANITIENLNANNILNMTDNNNIIKIEGDGHDIVHTNSTWNETTNQSGVENGYTRYESVSDNNTHVFVDIHDTIIHTDF